MCPLTGTESAYEHFICTQEGTLLVFYSFVAMVEKALSWFAPPNSEETPDAGSQKMFLAII